MPATATTRGTADEQPVTTRWDSDEGVAVEVTQEPDDEGGEDE